MAKTSDQMKNMVEDYLKISGAIFSESTSEIKLKNPKVEWQFLIGKIHITKLSGRDDRILIHNPLLFGKHSDKFNDLPTPVKFGVINQINQFVTLMELTTSWVSEPSEESKKDNTKPPSFKGLNIQSYIDETELTRPNLYRKLDALMACYNIANNLLAQKMHPNVLQDVSTNDSPKGDMFQ